MRIPDRYKVLGAGIASLVLSVGVARFSYTPLLPIMQNQAGLGLDEGGWLAAINYVGYLGGALIVSMISDLTLKDRLYRFGMVSAVLTTAMMGATTDRTFWAASRFLAGFSSAAGMLLGTGLILNWLIRQDHRAELGIHFMGIGLGIAGAALGVALMSHWQFDWHQQWYIFTLAGCVLLLPALAWLPAPDSSPFTRSGQTMRDAPPTRAFLRLFMLAYFCFGVGYVVSATFLVAIINRLPGLEGRGNLAFLFMGMGGVAGCLVSDVAARKMGDLNALILAALLQIVGILLPLMGRDLALALAGAAINGACCVAIVHVVLSMAGRYYPTRPAKMMGKMTLSYGVAQVIAPALTGSIAARLGSYEFGLYLAAAIMASGMVVVLLLRSAELRAEVRIPLAHSC